MIEEALGARMYTGPMFVKYNGVLRGLNSSVSALKRAMIKLCCTAAVASEYEAADEASEANAYQAACKQLNIYTTTLHAINSSIVKLGKLTIATKVYRGLSGFVLPEQFWEANEFGVKGGIEGAFMSTTTDRAVAMSYAAGSGGRAGFVFEIQQGMIDRGADIGFLSQVRACKPSICAHATALRCCPLVPPWCPLLLPSLW